MAGTKLILKIIKNQTPVLNLLKQNPPVVVVVVIAVAINSGRQDKS